MARPKVLMAQNEEVQELYMDEADLERLQRLADLDLFLCDDDKDLDLSEQLTERLANVEGLILSPGAPRIEAAAMDRAPDLKIIGEMEGDRFANRIDVVAQVHAPAHRVAVIECGLVRRSAAACRGWG